MIAAEEASWRRTADQVPRRVSRSAAADHRAGHAAAPHILAGLELVARKRRTRAIVGAAMVGFLASSARSSARARSDVEAAAATAGRRLPRCATAAERHAAAAAGTTSARVGVAAPTAAPSPRSARERGYRRGGADDRAAADRRRRPGAVAPIARGRAIRAVRPPPAPRRRRARHARDEDRDAAPAAATETADAWRAPAEATTATRPTTSKAARRSSNLLPVKGDMMTRRLVDRDCPDRDLRAASPDRRKRSASTPTAGARTRRSKASSRSPASCS